MRLTLFLLIPFLASLSLAAPQDVNTLAKDFEKQKKTLEEQELKQRQVLSALYQINKRIKKTVTEKSEAMQERAFVEGNIHTLAVKIGELETQAKSQKAHLAERLKAIYQLGGQSLARLFLNTSSSAQMERNLKIMGLIAGRDLDLIRGYTQDMKDLQVKKEKLAGRLAYLKQLEGRILRQEKNYLAEQNTKNKILDGIRKSKLFALNKINSLREKSLQYNIDDAGLFDLLFRPSFSDQKGQLPAPLQGIVSEKFGFEKAFDHPYTLNHKGIFITASLGQDIKSVFEGTVSFAGELPGFGKTLIIDHGDHYYTVYSHAQELKVRMGEEVSQSQAIATVGHSARDSRDGLYFEIRHFSEPYDPQLWMKGFSL